MARMAKFTNKDGNEFYVNPTTVRLVRRDQTSGSTVIIFEDNHSTSTPAELVLVIRELDDANRT